MNEWLLFFHVLFAVVWLGGAVYVEGLMATANRTGDASAVMGVFTRVAPTNRRLFSVAGIGAIVFGFWLVAELGLEFEMHKITDIRAIGRAAQAGGADGLSLINTVNSIIGVDLDTFRPFPHVAGRGSHGGYCGPAVKPIAMHMVHALAADPEIHIPISGIGGIQAWQDAVEFMLLGASTVQICTAVMHYGFSLIEHMVSGLEHWMIDKGFENTSDFVGKTVPAIGDWGELDLA